MPEGIICPILSEQFAFCNLKTRVNNHSPTAPYIITISSLLKHFYWICNGEIITIKTLLLQTFEHHICHAKPSNDNQKKRHLAESIRMRCGAPLRLLCYPFCWMFFLRYFDWMLLWFRWTHLHKTRFHIFLWNPHTHTHAECGLNIYRTAKYCSTARKSKLTHIPFLKKFPARIK